MTATKPLKICVECQAQFRPLMRTQIVCGDVCRKVQARKRDRESSRKRYHEDPTYRARCIAKSVAKFRSDPEYREKEAQRRRCKRAELIESRKQIRPCEKCGVMFETADKKREYCTSICRRAAAKEVNAKRKRERYHSDPEFRSRVRERSRVRMLDPEYRKLCSHWAANWRRRKLTDDPDCHAKILRRHLEKIKNDPAHWFEYQTRQAERKRRSRRKIALEKMAAELSEMILSTTKKGK